METVTSTDCQNNPNKLRELELQVAELTRTNGILKANISTLYRTARLEIARKDDRISQLQLELDETIFRLMGVECDNVETKNTLKDDAKL